MSLSMEQYTGNLDSLDASSSSSDSYLQKIEKVVSAVDYLAASYQWMKKAETNHLKDIFDRYASHYDENRQQKCMTAEDFVRKYLGLLTDDNYNKHSLRLIASAADVAKDGLITFDEFQAFETILRNPDALYLTAFEMFDTTGSGVISFDQFKSVIRHTQSVIDTDFDFDCQFIKSYFGSDKKRVLGYLDFCQLLHDFYDEQGAQAFRKFDANKSGRISALDFNRIMTTVKSHMLTDFVRQNLVSATSLQGVASHSVSFPYYLAFNSMLSSVELFRSIFGSLSKGSSNVELSKEEFLHAAQSYSWITPLQVDILFRLSELNHPGHRCLTLQDLELIDPCQEKRMSRIKHLTSVTVAKDQSERGFVVKCMESGYRFALGALGGACGATAVYPIDLVKTRMQNQRSGPYVGEVMYRNSADCFKKVLRHEGALGLYRGLLPQLMGVAPEKAIKLAVNDGVRDFFTRNQKIPFWAEILAGGCGGACQVVFTNPVEIIKIRKQVAGEVTHGLRPSAWSIMRSLGPAGLYKGCSACLLRDIPFSAIYFPVYAHAKLYTADENGQNSLASLFASAFIAGVPAAGLVTPADVIKTRLQVAARAGQTAYTGLFDCCRKVMREENFRAFWKGTSARVFRSSPQFGVTLMVYELLQRLFYVDFGSKRTVSAPEKPVTTPHNAADLIGGFALANATFSGIEHKFGLFLPRFEPPMTSPATSGSG